MERADVAIVGGGIAGSTLALVLARRGMHVTVLERQRDYADRVRGEYMHPWGVAEAQRLGVLDILLEAGGLFATRSIRYDESFSTDVAEARTREIADVLPGVPGALCVGHPAACRALARSAEAAGARYWRGAGGVAVTTGPRPAVGFDADGARHHVESRLIVGADGRTSTVRAQAGIRLEADAPSHLFAGLLVGGLLDWPQAAAITATEGDVQCQIFPQGNGRARLYAIVGLDQRRRYDAGAGAFLADFRRMRCMPRASALAAATPLGPCATFGGEDTWVDVPFAEGVALIGDAAGYNDPLIGQGLSLALRDARDLSDILLGSPDWTPAKLAAYGQQRRARSARVRFTAQVMAALNAAFDPESRTRRHRFLSRLPDADFRGRHLFAALGLGPDRTPDWAYTADFRAEILS